MQTCKLSLLLLFADERPIVIGLLHRLKAHQQDIQQKLDSVLGHLKPLLHEA